MNGSQTLHLKNNMEELIKRTITNLKSYRENLIEEHYLPEELQQISLDIEKWEDELLKV